MMHIRKKDSITATVDSEEKIDYSAFDRCMPLDIAIQESLIGTDGCFICAVNQTFVIMKHNQEFFLFDSHARNSFGLVDPNGRSLLMQLADISQVYEYCSNLAQGIARENQWFEVTGVNVTIDEGLACEIEAPSYAENSYCIAMDISEDTAKNVYQKRKTTNENNCTRYTPELKRKKYSDKTSEKRKLSCSNCDENEQIIVVQDLPDMIEISGKMMHIRKKDSITATVDSEEKIDYSAFDRCMPLDIAIQESLIGTDGCFICAVNQTFVIMKHNQEFFLFDSHARNSFGLVDPNGRSLLMQLADISQVYEYCSNLAQGIARENQWFEVTGVNVTIDEGLPCEIEAQSYAPNSNRNIIADMNVSCEDVPENLNSSLDENVVETKNDSKMRISKENNNNKHRMQQENNQKCTNELTQLSDEDVLTEAEYTFSYGFSPLGVKSKKCLCRILGISSKHVLKAAHNAVSQMGPPLSTKQIASDEIKHFAGRHRLRSLSYDDNSSLHRELVQLQHGGVGVYHKLDIPFEEILGIAKNLECIVFKITTIDTYVAIIYRPPKYCISTFMAALNFLLDNLENLSTKIVVTGDFNQDILSNNKTVLNCMSSRGFTQYVDEPTTENGTLIDHVYAKGCEHIKVQVVPTYYSYHEAIQITLK
uniref:Endonuclease/exonuclease/phosphatase domain-containing protein n=1 Tax=Magallana gigas TaxID=29159 RepID=A0A8W8JJZ6_MAGGI